MGCGACFVSPARKKAGLAGVEGLMEGLTGGVDDETMAVGGMILCGGEVGEVIALGVWGRLPESLFRCAVVALVRVVGFGRAGVVCTGVWLTEERLLGLTVSELDDPWRPGSATPEDAPISLAVADGPSPRWDAANWEGSCALVCGACLFSRGPVAVPPMMDASDVGMDDAFVGVAGLDMA